MKNVIFILAFLLSFTISFGQSSERGFLTGLIYVKGIRWYENEKQDSVKRIVI